MFKNPIALIWESIEWALKEVRPYLAQDLVVIVNGYSIDRLIDRNIIHSTATKYGGALIKLGEEGLVSVMR